MKVSGITTDSRGNGQWIGKMNSITGILVTEGWQAEGVQERVVTWEMGFMNEQN